MDERRENVSVDAAGQEGEPEVEFDSFYSNSTIFWRGESSGKKEQEGGKDYKKVEYIFNDQAKTCSMWLSF